jgi:hypothetical protein
MAVCQSLSVRFFPFREQTPYSALDNHPIFSINKNGGTPSRNLKEIFRHSITTNYNKHIQPGSFPKAGCFNFKNLKQIWHSITALPANRPPEFENPGYTSNPVFASGCCD